MESKIKNADFCIEIDYEKGSESPSRVFKTMSELIETFERLDMVLIESIDAKIEPVTIIEDIEAGSIKAWLTYVLKKIPDDAIKSLDPKKVIGEYLVKGKYAILDWTSKTTLVKERADMLPLEKELNRLAQNTRILKLPYYPSINRQKLLTEINGITTSLSHLTGSDKAIYITNEENIGMNAQFNIAPETIDELLTKETLNSKGEMILKIKKPDYLGESQWEFRHGNRRIMANIIDKNWLIEFHDRKIDVRPGDSLRCEVRVEVSYGYDGEVVAERNIIMEVHEVITGLPPEQGALFSQ